MGFEKEILAQGDASKVPTKGKNVTVHCTGFGKNGDLKVPFWSTKDPGQQPFTFKIGTSILLILLQLKQKSWRSLTWYVIVVSISGLGQVIKGWDEGVMTMSLGEKARLTCTPDYGYGASGMA